MTSAPRVFISVAEMSADVYGAGLIRAFRQRFPQATFVGLTGPQCREAGAVTLHDLSARATMLLGVVGRIPEALLLLRRLRRELSQNRPDAAVLIDGARIARIGPRRELPQDIAVHALPAGAWLAPGFIDLQVNGGGDVLFNETPTADAISRSVWHPLEMRYRTTSCRSSIIHCAAVE